MPLADGRPYSLDFKTLAPANLLRAFNGIGPKRLLTSYCDFPGHLIPRCGIRAATPFPQLFKILGNCCGDFLLFLE